MRRAGVAFRRGMLVASILAVRANVSAADGAAPPAADPSGYPVAVTVRLTAASRRATFEYDALGYTLVNPSCTVPLAAPALAAYERAARALFAGAPGAPTALELEVDLVGAEIEQSGSTGVAVVEHGVVLLAGGGPLDAWRLRGESRIVGLDADGVRRAFARAAGDAASRLERSLSASAAVSEWLTGQGVALRPVPAPPPTRPPPPPRPRWLAFVDAGGTLLVTPADEIEFPLTLRTGIATRWLFAQATFDRWSVEPESAVSSTWWSSGPESAAWDVTAMGLDAGGVVRLGASSEFRAGAGVRYVRGRTEVSYVANSTPWQTEVERAAVSPSVFIAYQVLAAAVRDRRIGLRIGVELRKHFGATLAAGGLAPELELANVACAVTLGAEIGLSR